MALLRMRSMRGARNLSASTPKSVSLPDSNVRSECEVRLHKRENGYLYLKTLPSLLDVRAFGQSTSLGSDRRPYLGKSPSWEKVGERNVVRLLL